MRKFLEREQVKDDSGVNVGVDNAIDDNDDDDQNCSNEGKKIPSTNDALEMGNKLKDILKKLEIQWNFISHNVHLRKKSTNTHVDWTDK